MNNHPFLYYRPSAPGTRQEDGGTGHRGATHDVLDHGLVCLVDYMGSDMSVVRGARVSYDAAWRTGENEGNDDKLLRRLWTGGEGKPARPAPAHSTPFEAVTFTFEVKAPIFVFRQWHRHRTQSYNELSLRYKETPDDQYYLPEPGQVGKQSTSSKQGREDSFNRSEQELKAQLAGYSTLCDDAFAEYHALLKEGWPRELARCVLPLATYSHMFTTGNLLNFLKFLTLRSDSHAQYEIRQYAYAMINLLGLVVPKTIMLWEEGVHNP